MPVCTEACHARKCLKIKACGLFCAYCDAVTDKMNI
nr:MAG TPA: Radical SAM superfamily [Caudoviricetes sp.]